MRLQTICDLRYFESDQPNVYGSPPPSHMGKLYPIDHRHRDFWHLGDRFARKLGEYRQQLPGFDHVYVNLTPLLEHGAAVLNPIEHETWFRYVDVGMPPDVWLSSEHEARYRLLLQSASAAIRAISNTHELDCSCVSRVEAELLQERSNLEILRLAKETTQYHVRITYQIHPNGKKSQAYVTYQDKKTGHTGKAPLTELHFYEDIVFLAASISVSGGIIRIKPRDSFTASLHIRRYTTPLELPVATVLSHSSERRSGPDLENG